MKTLQDLKACSEAQRWCSEQPNAYRAYLACERPDWLFWLAGKLDIDRKVIVLAACSIARTALIHIPEGEDRPRIALETAEAWCRGEAMIDQVNTYAAYAAYAAAYAATYTAYTAYSAYSAYAATDAATAAATAAAYAAASYDAAYASYDAAYAATAAATAAANATAADAAYAADAADAATAADAAYAAARKKAQKEHCKIIRSFIPWSMIKEAAQ